MCLLKTGELLYLCFLIPEYEREVAGGKFSASPCVRGADSGQIVMFSLRNFLCFIQIFSIMLTHSMHIMKPS